jgi:hypothetical protein
VAAIPGDRMLRYVETWLIVAIEVRIGAAGLRRHGRTPDIQTARLCSLETVQEPVVRFGMRERFGQVSRKGAFAASDGELRAPHASHAVLPRPSGDGNREASNASPTNCAGTSQVLGAESCPCAAARKKRSILTRAELNPPNWD